MIFNLLPPEPLEQKPEKKVNKLERIIDWLAVIPKVNFSRFEVLIIFLSGMLLSLILNWIL